MALKAARAGGQGRVRIGCGGGLKSIQGGFRRPWECPWVAGPGLRRDSDATPRGWLQIMLFVRRNHRSHRSLMIRAYFPACISLFQDRMTSGRAPSPAGRPVPHSNPATATGGVLPSTGCTPVALSACLRCLQGLSCSRPARPVI